MSIWNDPDISFEQFAKYVSDSKNKAALQKIWKQKTKTKTTVSQLQNHELSDILVSFQTQCITSFNKDCGVKSDQLQDSAHLFSDWIFENKLSGIPSNDEDDYNKMKVMDIFTNNALLFNWINEALIPLQTYINSKNEHDPSLSQQEIASKNKRMINKHPSLAHLFQQKLVNQKHNEFTEYKNAQTQKEEQRYNNKHVNADQNVHHLRKSRAMLFFNHSDAGYETKRKCKIYKDEELTDFLIQVSKGELFGGKADTNKDKTVLHIIEPIVGYIHSKYVKSFALDSAQWKFLEHQRSMTTVASQSLTLRLNNEDLFVPSDEDTQYESKEQETNEKNQKMKVQFKPYNENEEEKKLETSAAETGLSLKDRRLIKAKEDAQRILNLETSMRKAKDVISLWTAGFNLHDLEILKQCYNVQVTSQQFVNQELTARDPVLQCLKQMFDASDDVGIEIKNVILQKGNVILEFRTFGNKKEDSQVSPTNSNTTHSNNGSNHTYSNGNGNGNGNGNENGHLLGSYPTKSGMPQKVINGVGIFTVSKGEIMSQRLFWDQDQQWFSDMNVIKMPQSSSLSQFLYKNKFASPVLNLKDEHLSDEHSNNSSMDNQPILNDGGNGMNQETLNGDNNIIYEMNDEMNEILALRGLNISDVRQYESQNGLQSRKEQIAQAMFWLAVGAMFVFIVPKYLGKPKR